jgi:hypothetical protein
MSVGDIWTTQENISPVKHNAKDWFSGTGSQIASLPFSQQHNFARCTSTGSGFVADRCYYRNAGQTVWLPFFTKHAHDADTDAAGGELFDILVNGLKKIYFIDYQNLQAAFLGSEKTAGATYADVLTGSDKYVQLGTTTGVDSYSAATAGGLTFDFASRSSLYWKQSTSHDTDILMRSGVNVNPANDAPTTRIQYGMELCTGDGTTLQLVTANGVARTKLPTGVVGGTTVRGFAMTHTPGTSVLFKSSSGATVTKTTNIPSSGTAQPDDVINFSVRTTNTTLKTMRLYALLFAGKVGDPNWVTS